MLPFDVNRHYPTEIAGVKMENYIAWMRSACYSSAAGEPGDVRPGRFQPVVSRPIGMQIVGRHHDDSPGSYHGVLGSKSIPYDFRLLVRFVCEARYPNNFRHSSLKKLSKTGM